MLRTHAGLRGRLLQSWVKNKDRGFTARDWIACKVMVLGGAHCSLNSTSPHGDVLLLTYLLPCACKEGFRWMEEGALRDFCDRLGELRTLVDCRVCFRV